MSDTKKTKDETKAAGEDWAVLPFDEREDDARWDKLISETDELAERAAAIDWDDGEVLTENNLSDDAAEATEPSPKSDDDDIAAMNPF